MKQQIGILTYVSVLCPDEDEKIYCDYIRAILEVGSQKGVDVVSFDFESIDFESGKIRGYTFDKKIIEKETTIPEVIYIAGALDEPDRKKHKMQVKKKLEARGVRFLNPPALTEVCTDKTKSYDLFRAFDLNQPETISFSEENLAAFLQKYDSIFVKPIKGMRTHGMIIIKKTENQKCDLQLFYEENYVKNKKALSCVLTDQLLSQLLALMEKSNIKPEDYFIQQGIDPLRYQDRRVFFRGMVQRGTGGEIRDFCIDARIFGKDRVVGKKVEPEKILEDFSLQLKKKVSAQELRDILEQESVQGTEALEQEVGPVGEVGFDLVLDTKGQAWIIEANSRPGHRDTHHQVFAKNAVDYLSFLASKKHDKKN
ncbi:YheC/YheD family protein [Patescibacteria group bacterium]|nr:YheC/YheD family protein [Patescibacteria group bacterium]